MSLKSAIARNFGTASLTTVLIVSLGFNVYLASHAAFPSKVQRPQPLKAGAEVKPFAVEDSEGKPVNISFSNDSRPTVLYVLAPHCGWCKRNESNMQTLFGSDNSKYRFIGISIDDHDLKKYVADKREPFPVYLLKSKEVAKELRIAGTPTTIVVDPQGRVLRAWSGVYVGDNQKEVEQFFAAKLPGLPQTASLAR